MDRTEVRRDDEIHVVFGGDVMLGRLVKKAILQYGAGYPLGPVAKTMRDADLAIVNLECAITPNEAFWAGAPKAFYFGAPPEAIHALLGAGVDIVSLANNHVLDFDVEGLLDTLGVLDRHEIRHAGAGLSQAQAQSPALIQCKGASFGMAAFCDHQADFEAGERTPGMAYIDLKDETAATEAFRRALESLRNAAVDWPVLSLHWGPNMVFRPSQKFRRLAHAAIEMGWRIVYGHSAHVFHGIEIYRGCPILYACGDLVDDYYVDPDFKNDHQLLFELVLERETLRRIELHPVFIDRCQVRPASADEAEYIAGWMTSLCAEMETKVERDEHRLWIEAGT